MNYIPHHLRFKRCSPLTARQTYWALVNLLRFRPTDEQILRPADMQGKASDKQRARRVYRQSLESIRNLRIIWEESFDYLP